jgi:Uma2 family endonuclease
MLFSMTANPAHWGVDFVQYLRFEVEAEEKHELIDGDIVAMAGAPRRHNLLCERIRDALRPSLGDGPCTLLGSDQRLAVDSAVRGWVGYYPDLAIYCSDAAHELNADTLIAPTLLVEVTSKTTEKRDRGVKLEDYLPIPSLVEYLIVSLTRRELELWTRAGKEWTRQVVTAQELRLRRGAVLSVDRLYADLPE